MRKPYNLEISLFCQWPEHKLSKQLEFISDLLDQYPEFNSWAAEDLKAGLKGKTSGAHGMTAEQVLRAGIIKQQNKWSYEFLELQCVDSSMTRAFLRLDHDLSYSRSCLQNNISKIRALTWSLISEKLVLYALEKGIEKGRTIRMDATVIESNIHSPSDSTLLFDCIRVLDRCFKKIRSKKRAKLYLSYTAKDAKKILMKIINASDQDERKEHYRDLLKMASSAQTHLPKALKMASGCKESLLKEIKNIDNMLPLIIDQTRRRVIKGEAIPSEEKILSIFEAHTDIIVKGQRDVVYGHKVFLTAGKSGLILDCQLTQENPSDAVFFMELLDKQVEIYGKAPRQTTADGGFASIDNVLDAKILGVTDVCFSKPCGIEKEEMVKSPWVFQKLRNFRAGIEGIISTLKRGFGLDRALWKGVSGFASYVHSSVVAYNLTVLARLAE